VTKPSGVAEQALPQAGQANEGFSCFSVAPASTG
jgi:hypothetical protein